MAVAVDRSAWAKKIFLTDNNSRSGGLAEWEWDMATRSEKKWAYDLADSLIEEVGDLLYDAWEDAAEATISFVENQHIMSDPPANPYRKEES